MRALLVENSAGSKPSLKLRDIEKPTPGEGEVLIEVRAAGVTPSELIWYPTTHTKTGEVRSGAVPGHEFSGTISAIGQNVSEFQVGNQVFGMNDWFDPGATAEYCLAVPSSIAPKPASLSHGQAAAVPISALTAWQGLHVRARLQREERVLVHGAAGTVGAFAVQLAKLQGAFVVASASARDAEFVRDLGADVSIDYKSQGQSLSAMEPFDVVFDTVGGETLRQSWPLLKANGRLVTIAASEETTDDERSKAAFFIVEPDHEQLVQVGQFLEAGRLRVFVGAEVSLQDAAEAYSGQVARRGPGKIVVMIPARS